MTTPGTGDHSTAAAVTAAVLELNGGGHPFTVDVDDKGRLIGSKLLADTGGTGKFGRLRVTLLGETGEYTMYAYQTEEVLAHPTMKPISNYAYSYSSSEISDPVAAVLAAHGWHKKKSGFARFFGRLFGRG